jgi:hypothetical protein
VKYVVNVIEVFLDESADARVGENGAVGTVGDLVVCEWSFDGTVIYKGVGSVRDLWF